MRCYTRGKSRETTGGTHTIQVTLMQLDYVGHIVTQIGGNCKGRDVLDFDFGNETEFDTPYTRNDCSLLYDENLDIFYAKLKNAAGAELQIGESAEEMNKMIVAIEIIDFKEDEAWD